MMAAMAYVMIRENLHDQKFLDKYAMGFDQYKDYLLGIEDGVAKTPDWAESITGVPSSTIEKLAREYATSKPAALMEGLGPGRGAAGEQFARSTMTLAAMTGNIGIPGGSAGGGWRIPVGELFRNPSVPVPKNPVEAGAPSVRGSLDFSRRLLTRVHINKVWDAVLEGKAGGYPADIKLAYICGSNPLNQRSNCNKGVAALKQLEFIAILEAFMTPTAKFADIVLPVSGPLERNDLCRPWGSGPYYLYVNKAIDPLYERKSDFEIACELAPRLGIHDYNDKTEDQWLREFVATAPDMAAEITDYDKFKREGVHRVSVPEPIVAFKKNIEDLENNPFPTPSGKIEIYSRRLADLNDPLCPPVPKQVETWESPRDPLAEKYPLQLITPHSKTRVHSQMGNVPWLMEIERHSVWINPADGKDRGIADGDEVMVFNDRGKTLIAAKVTERIIPGVVSIPQGAWYDPDEDGTDRGGCANVLTRDVFSPGGAFPANTALVDVRKT
jgi:anaerobic dimethyl sulfoxide reductase subunit A